MRGAFLHVWNDARFFKRKRNFIGFYRYYRFERKKVIEHYLFQTNVFRENPYFKRHFIILTYSRIFQTVLRITSSSSLTTISVQKKKKKNAQSRKFLGFVFSIYLIRFNAFHRFFWTNPLCRNFVIKKKLYFHFESRIYYEKNTFVNSIRCLCVYR